MQTLVRTTRGTCARMHQPVLANGLRARRFGAEQQAYWMAPGRVSRAREGHRRPTTNASSVARNLSRSRIGASKVELLIVTLAPLPRNISRNLAFAGLTSGSANFGAPTERRDPT